MQRSRSGHVEKRNSRMREGERPRRQELYGVFGFLKSQLQTPGATICAQDSIGELGFPYMYKSRWGFLSVSPSGGRFAKWSPR